MNSREALFVILIIQLLFSTTFCCNPTTNPNFTYSYNWKERNNPIYTGDSVPQLIALCPKGCSGGCPIPDCDDDALEALREAQHQVKGFEVFSSNIFIPLIIRCVLLVIIILMNLFLFCSGHFRIRDLWTNADDKWINEEDPTTGMEQDVWANLKFFVTRDPNTQTTDQKDHQTEPEPLPKKPNVYAGFRKILKLFYGRERFYRLARAFNPLKWELQNFGSKPNDDLQDLVEVEKDKKRKELTEKYGEYDYDWKEDLFEGKITPGLIYTMFDEVPDVPEQKIAVPQSVARLFAKPATAFVPKPADNQDTKKTK